MQTFWAKNVENIYFSWNTRNVGIQNKFEPIFIRMNFFIFILKNFQALNFFW